MDMGVRGGVSRRERVWHIQGSTTLTGIHVEHRGRSYISDPNLKGLIAHLRNLENPEEATERFFFFCIKGELPGCVLFLLFNERWIECSTSRVRYSRLQSQ